MLRLIRRIRRWWRGDIDADVLAGVRDRRETALDTRAEHAFRDGAANGVHGTSGFTSSGF